MAATVACGGREGAMGNSRVKERFELALDAKQVMAVLLGSLVILGGVFILGVSVGRQASAARAPVISAPKDPLARLDEPIAPRDEAPPVLKAHQALTDPRSIDKTLPVPAVRAVAATPPAAPAPVPVAAVRPAPPATPAPAPDPKVATPAPKVATPAPKVATPAPKVAAPAPKAAAAKPESVGAMRGGAYAIQVGSMPTREDAERFARKHAGRHPRIVSADLPGKGRWYRVVIGDYATQEAAKRQLATLTRAGISGIVTLVR
jgi:cell division protein FtsN